MKYTENNGLRSLRAKDKYHRIMKHGNDESYYEVVYLSRYGSIDDYYEVSVFEIEGFEYPDDSYKVEYEIIKKQEEDDERDAIIIELATQLAIMQLTM